MPVANILEKRFLIPLSLCATAVFLYSGGYEGAVAAWREWKAVRAVRAAGTQPSFELKRTERLSSERHAARETITITLARRRDGSEATITETRFEPRHVTVERVVLLKEQGLRVELDDHLKAKSTFHYLRSDPRFVLAQFMRMDVSSQCAKGLDGRSFGISEGSDVLSNVLAFRFVTKGADSVRTTWRAPSLGCVVVRDRFEWGQSGKPGWSLSDSGPDYIRLGEPSPALFEVPADYQEMKPSERFRRNAQHFGTDWELGGSRRPNDSYFAQADAAYARGR